MYATTTDLLDALEDATGEVRLGSVYLSRWRDAGLIRPLVRHRRRDLGAAWPDWTLPMARLCRLELRGNALGAQARHGYRTILDVLTDVADALADDPDAVFVTITADGTVEPHQAADTVANLCTATGNVLIVAIPRQET